MKRRLLTLLLLSVPLCAVQARIPSPVRDTTGVVCAEFVYDSAEFPSCHAATVVETAQGEVMIALFGGKHESNADCSIWVSHLRAGGWELPTLVADGMVDSVKTACWNPVLYQVPDGELLLFYKVGTCVQEWTGWLVRSSDGGYTWSTPERLPDGILGPIKNKPVLLGDRLVCGTSLERGGWRTYMEMTDPAVGSWRTVGPLNNRKSRIQIIQPSLLRHADGTLQAICRAVDLRGNIISIFSADEGETWSEPVSSGLPNNDSGLDAVALQDGRFLLVYNHIQASRNGVAARSPINVALSDNGSDWYATLVLEDSPGDEYSYPSVIQSRDGLVHIVYTWHRQCIKHVVLDPARLQIDPVRRIVDEQWVDALPVGSKRVLTGGDAGGIVVDSLLARMTLADKLASLAGSWVPHDRGTHDLYGGRFAGTELSPFRMEYAAQGVHTNGKSTLYPAPLALAAMFDDTCVERVARSIAADCRARGIDAAIAPELTLYNRSEPEHQSDTFGDDAEHVVRTAKRFARGLTTGTVVPLARYRAVDGGPATAQQKVLRTVLQTYEWAGIVLRGASDGVYATEDSLFNRAFLRDECRFGGLLIGDCWQTHASLAAFRGGLNLDLPRGEWLTAEKLLPLVESGMISGAEVDARVAETLAVLNRFGLTTSRGVDESIPENREESRRVSLDAARRSLVLLENRRRILPLTEPAEQVLVLGNRVWRNSESRGATSVYPFRHITLGDALAESSGFDLLPPAREYVDLTLTGEFTSGDAAGAGGLLAEYFATGQRAGMPAATGIEPFVDYAWGTHIPVSADEGRFSARWSGIYRPAADGIVRFGLSGHGRCRLFVDGKTVCTVAEDAAFDEESVWLFQAESGREYRIRVEFEAVDDTPDIQLTYTPLRVDDLEGRMRRASKIVLSVGSDGRLDDEARFWLELARDYRKKTIVVMQSCDLADMTWCDGVAGVVQAWHAGDAAGQAIADLLLGRFVPSGRMPVTTAHYPFGYGLRYE